MPCKIRRYLFQDDRNATWEKMVGSIMFIVASANIWSLIFLKKRRRNALGMHSK